MKYDRYIDNRVLQSCIRPQLPKWCGPTTISEIIHILLKKIICPHEVARLMNWDPQEVIKGMGTSMVLKGLSVVSKNAIKSQIIDIESYNKGSLWNLIKNIMLKTNDLLYLHEQGHHVLICGFIEEPIITPESFKAGIDCSVSNPYDLPSSLSHPNDNSPKTKKTWSEIKRILINAEHNIKEPEKGLGSILKERDFETVNLELRKNNHRLHLVRIFKAPT